MLVSTTGVFLFAVGSNAAPRYCGLYALLWQDLWEQIITELKDAAGGGGGGGGGGCMHGRM